MQRELVVVPTTGDGQEVGLPGDDVEHASYGNAGQRAVEATQAEVDGVQGRCNSEGCERRQASVLSSGWGGWVSWGLPALPENHHSSQSPDQSSS